METQDIKNKAAVIGNALLMERSILENKRRLAMKMAVLENGKMNVRTKDPIALPYIEKIRSGTPIQPEEVKAVLDTVADVQTKNDDAAVAADQQDAERETKEKAEQLNQMRLQQELEERQQASRRKYQVHKKKTVSNALRNTGIAAGVLGAGTVSSLGGFTILFG